VAAACALRAQILVSFTDWERESLPRGKHQSRRALRAIGGGDVMGGTRIAMSQATANLTKRIED